MSYDHNAAQWHEARQKLAAIPHGTPTKKRLIIIFHEGTDIQRFNECHDFLPYLKKDSVMGGGERLIQGLHEYDFLRDADLTLLTGCQRQEAINLLLVAEALEWLYPPDAQPDGFPLGCTDDDWSLFISDDELVKLVRNYPEHTSRIIDIIGSKEARAAAIEAVIKAESLIPLVTGVL